MSRGEALETAIERAVGELRDADLGCRWSNLGLSEPERGGVDLRMFGRDLRLDTAGWTVADRSSGAAIRPADRLLLLHYLMCDLPVEPTGELISFRELPGGQFYYGPFRGRTVEPLVNRFGNDLEALRSGLDRFDHQPTELGDLGARIHGLGNLWITLVYRVGDDEFPASADVLFDSCVKRVYGAEDVTVMAGRICLGLL